MTRLPGCDEYAHDSDDRQAKPNGDTASRPFVDNDVTSARCLSQDDSFRLAGAELADGRVRYIANINSSYADPSQPQGVRYETHTGRVLPPFE